MTVKRIVRSKHLVNIVFLMILSVMFSLGFLIQGYMPFGPFGEPDPTVIFIVIILDSIIVYYWARSYLLLITDKIFTIRGLFRVHSRKPINIFDPLKYVKFNKIKNLSKEALAQLTVLVHAKYGTHDKDGLEIIAEQKHLEEFLMPKIVEFRDREYKNYLGKMDYNRLVHGVMLQEYYEDGGSWQFGWRGAKRRGNAVMVTPVGMVRNYGTDAIQYSNILNFWGIDIFGFELKCPKKHTQTNDIDDLTNEIVMNIENDLNPPEYETLRFLGLPHYIILAVIDLNPNFRLGDHMVCYGTEPLHNCVRALVEDNEFVQDSELVARPRWIWGFPAIDVNIDPEARIKYIEDGLKAKMAKSITDTADSFDRVKQVEEKATGKQEPEPVAPVPVDENGKEATE
jgi:hypothetical protein